MKKMLIFATFVLVFICSSVGTLAIDNIDSGSMVDIDASECFMLTTDFVEDFYEARCDGSDFITSTQIKDVNLLSIIDSKVRILRACDIAEIDSYMVDVSLRDYLIEGDLIYLKVVIEFSYNYIGDSGSSSYSTVDFFLFEKEGLRDYSLLYWLDASNPASSLDNSLYDMEDFYTSSLIGFKTWLSFFDGYDVYVDYAAQVAAEKEQFFDEMFGPRSDRSIVSTEPDETLSYLDIQPPQRVYGIYHTTTSDYELLWTDLMTSYASSEYNEVNPQSGSTTISYYDFYMENANGVATSWDCTNFVSHCLLAGGAQMYNDGTINSWWCAPIVSGEGTYSAPWTVVRHLYNFLIRESVTPGPFANRAYDNDGNSNFVFTSTFSLGDIIQKDTNSNGSWDHSLIITGSRTVSGYSDPIPYVVSRTGPDINSSGALTSLYLTENPSYRILRLVGYRTN
ncbi:MAG: amidase domain-containing protein [Clostridia bacterium]|nr:amidase domain-containing protein [Clostridia bacterium]